jgi:hypothetical protein
MLNNSLTPLNLYFLSCECGVSFALKADDKYKKEEMRELCKMYSFIPKQYGEA